MALKGRSAIFALLSMTTLGLPALAASAPGSLAVGRTEQTAEAAPGVPRGTSLGSRDEERAYAAREVASPDAKKYKGGDVIVISATALVVVLLIVLIIVLI